MSNLKNLMCEDQEDLIEEQWENEDPEEEP